MVNNEDLKENKINVEHSEEVDDSDIPPMPDWRKEKRKPFLEKSTRSNWDIRRDKIRLFLERSPVRPQLLVIILLLIVIVISLYYLVPREKAPEVALERAWLNMELPEIERDRFLTLSKQKSLDQKLLDVYFDKEEQLVHDIAYLEHEDSGNRASPLVLRTRLSAQFNFEEQMSLLDLYLARRSEDDFIDTIEEIKAYFSKCFSGEEVGQYWPEHLAYLRRLFIYSEFWETDSINEEIWAESELLYSLFSEGIKGRNEEFAERKNDYFYSTEKENYDEEYTISAVRLADIDLWVLQCLSEIDEDWRPIYEDWLEIVKKGKLESGFYAYAWNSEDNTYLPSAGASFRSETTSSLKQLRFLAELGEVDASALNLYDELIQSGMGLYLSYNSVSLAPWDDQYDLDALLLYQYIAAKLNSKLSETLVKEVLDTYREKRSESPAQSMLFLDRDSKDSFNFSNNLQAYLQNLP